jgi:hypothetical protein
VRNAQLRNRGLRPFLVRGLAKVKAILLWQALAHHLSPMISPAFRVALAT